MPAGRCNRATDGTRYAFELPFVWLHRAAVGRPRCADPPLSAQSARVRLASRAPDVEDIELADSLLRGVGPGDTCHNGPPYLMCLALRLTFDPVAAGHRLPEAVIRRRGALMAPLGNRVSNAWASWLPRVEPGLNSDPATPARGRSVSPPRDTSGPDAHTPEAMRAKIRMVIEGIARPDGTVSGAGIGDRSTRPGLDAEALKALENHRFAPGMPNGVPVPVFVTMTMTFNMR
jgi:TonB family protein